MLMGLQGIKQPEGFDENKQIDVEISSKMSKSKPETCILIHDTKEDIKRKIGNAFCPEKVVENNPVLEYAKYMIFRKLKKLEINRPAKYSGDIEIDSYEDLEKMYREGKIHPLDLKNAVAEALDKLVKPIRKHFEKNKKARDLLRTIKFSEA
jgi:tyrosyl-tRNA synthetase